MKTALSILKSGDSIVVGVNSVNEYVQVRTHACYDSVKQTPVILTTLQEDDSLYDKAIQLLWDDYHLVKTDEVERKKLLNNINRMKAKPTFYFGFTDINTGNPLIICVSEHQARTIKTATNKIENQLKKYPVKITKGDKGTWSILPFKGDLTPEQLINFESTSEIDVKVYDSLINKADVETQEADIKKFSAHFGFDFTRLGIS